MSFPLLNDMLVNKEKTKDDSKRLFSIVKESNRQSEHSNSKINFIDKNIEDDGSDMDDDDEPQQYCLKSSKGKPKMELNKYFEICRKNLLVNLDRVNNAKSSAIKVKYQAIINSLLLRLKRREDEMLLDRNHQQ